MKLDAYFKDISLLSAPFAPMEYLFKYYYVTSFNFFFF